MEKSDGLVDQEAYTASATETQPIIDAAMAQSSTDFSKWPLEMPFAN